MRKFNHKQPFGTVMPPTDRCHFQQGGCFYGADHEFVRIDPSTHDGQMLLKQGDVAAPAAPAVEENPVVQPKIGKDMPPATGPAIQATEDGAVDLDSIPDESGDSVSAEGDEIANPAREQLAAYIAGEEKMEWFSAQTLAEDVFGERPSSKKHLAELLRA